MLRIVGAENEYIEDFVDTTELGALVGGQIFDDELQEILGYYWARWFPLTLRDIELMLVLMPTSRSADKMAFAFRYSKDTQLTLVEPSEIWVDIFNRGTPVTVEEAMTDKASVYNQALELVLFAIGNDASISGHIRELGSVAPSNRPAHEP